MMAGGMLDATQWGDPIILNNAPSFDVSYYEDENGQGYYVMPQSAQISIVKVQGGGCDSPADRCKSCDQIRRMAMGIWHL